MPNGGVPISMVIRPASGGWVIYCHASELRVIESEEWEKAPWGEVTPTLVLSAEESLVLERFLRYWLDDRGPAGVTLRRDANVDSEYG
jgi:hypothetical protein